VLRALTQPGSAGLESDAAGDAMKPTGQRFGTAQRRRLARQHDKRGLKSVFDLVMGAENAPAGAQHEVAVASDQRGEGGLIALMDVAIQQLGVGEVGGWRGGPALHLRKDLIDGWCHDGPPRSRRCLLLG
jgi:hypothetical protein